MRVLEAAAEVPAADLIDLRVGSFWVVVRTSLGAGIASVLRSEDHLHGSQPVSAAGELHRWEPLELANLLRSDSSSEAAIGLAAVNALLGPSAEGLRDEKAVAILRERGRGQKGRDDRPLPIRGRACARTVTSCGSSSVV